MRRLLAALLAGALVAGCGSAPLLADVRVEPALITPDRDGDADVADISYQIGRPALLRIELQAADGTVHVLRDNALRSPGAYVAPFGGVIDDRMLVEGDYTVTLTATPIDGAIGTVTETHSLTIRGGDTLPPELVGFTVRPHDFTPNQDGLDDRVQISYRLDEPAEVRLWLEMADGRYVTDILEETMSASHPGEVGPHQYDFDAGVDADAPPPPDGDYVVVGEARDAAGNVTTERLPLTIRDGGQPRAALVGDVDWSATTLPVGATLTFTATVANVGDTPIRTRGPEAGFVYDNDASFNQTAPAGFILLARSGERAASRRVPATRSSMSGADLDLLATDEQPSEASTSLTTAITATTGTIRLCGTVRDGGSPAAGAEVFAFEPDGDNGISAVADAEGRYCFGRLVVPPAHERTYARSSGAVRLGLEYDDMETDLAYPFRWQLGRTAELEVCPADYRLYLCLPPGATVRITGGVRFVEPPLSRSTIVHLALQHEDVRIMHGPYGEQAITVEFDR